MSNAGLNKNRGPEGPRPFLLKLSEFENGFQNLGYEICERGSLTVEWVSCVRQKP